MSYVKYKPMPNEKVNRNKAIIEYHNSHPEMFDAEIARIFGISRSRLCQILHRNNHKKKQ